MQLARFSSKPPTGTENANVAMAVAWLQHAWLDIEADFSAGDLLNSMNIASNDDIL